MIGVEALKTFITSRQGNSIDQPVCRGVDNGVVLGKVEEVVWSKYRAWALFGSLIELGGSPWLALTTKASSPAGPPNWPRSNTNWAGFCASSYQVLFSSPSTSCVLIGSLLGSLARGPHGEPGEG